MNPLERFKRPLVLAAFVLSLGRLFTGADFPLLEEYTQITISGVCAAGLVVFLMFYKDEAHSKQATTKSPQPATTPDFLIVKEGNREISKAIEEAQHDKKEDIFSRFK